MVSYVAGEKVALAGVPVEGIRLIAWNYLNENLRSIGAGDEEYLAALEIRDQVKGGSNIFEQMMKVEELRAAALKGKKGPEAEKINKSHDLALAYFGIFSELRTAQTAGGDEAYTLPSLSLRLAKPRVDEIDGRTLSPAGKWRAQVDKQVEASKEKQETDRLAARPPIYAAIEELPESKRAELKRVLESAHKQAKDTGVTGSANLLANMTQILNSENTTWNWLTDGSSAAALKVIARAQEIAKERGTEDVFAKPSAKPAPAQQAQAKADANRVPLHGSPTNYYGQTLSTTADKARNNAFVAISSILLPDDKGNAVGLDRERIKTILSAIEVKPQYSNAELRNLHDQYLAAEGNPNEQNAIMAALGVLTLENRFAELRAQGKKWNMFADNASVVAFVDQAAANAANYAVDDQTVGAAPAAGSAGASKGFRKVYGRKDGTPPPPEDEVPTFTDAEQVKELQRSLGFTGDEVDGMYGPKTHAAMKAKSEEGKKPSDYDFSLEGIFQAFIAWLTGGSAPSTEQSTQPTGGIDANVLATAKTLMEGKSEAALDFSTKAANGVMDGIDDKTILGNLPAKLAPYKLTPEEMSSLRVSNGILSSDLLKSAERLLGLDADGKMDAKLQAAFEDETVRTALLAAVRSGAGSTEVAPPGSTPGGTGAAQGR